MENSVNRIMVNTIVKKAIHDLKSDPERTVRNLVDMALRFADSRFQQEFYSSAQRLLSNEQSGYYALVKNTISKMNEETLLTFSMNLGYNGLYQGAVKIREQEKKLQCSIPWSINLTITEGKVFDQHHTLIRQGEELGIHTWHLFSNHGIHDCISLAAKHPDSAFVIFSSSHEINLTVIDLAQELPNIALVIPFDADADAACSLLSASGILFGLYYTYTQKDLLKIESGELIEDMEQLYPIISILHPKFPCETKLRKRVYAWVTAARMEQKYHTIPWELYGDMLLVDSVISEPAIWVGFDEYGQLCTENGVDRTFGRNIYKNDLPYILQQAFPKKGTT